MKIGLKLGGNYLGGDNELHAVKIKMKLFNDGKSNTEADKRLFVEKIRGGVYLAIEANGKVYPLKPKHKRILPGSKYSITGFTDKTDEVDFKWLLAKGYELEGDYKEFTFDVQKHPVFDSTSGKLISKFSKITNVMFYNNTESRSIRYESLKLSGKAPESSIDGKKGKGSFAVFKREELTKLVDADFPIRVEESRDGPEKIFLLMANTVSIKCYILETDEVRDDYCFLYKGTQGDVQCYLPKEVECLDIQR